MRVRKQNLPRAVNFCDLSRASNEDGEAERGGRFFWTSPFSSIRARHNFSPLCLKTGAHKNASGFPLMSLQLWVVAINSTRPRSPPTPCCRVRLVSSTQFCQPHRQSSPPWMINDVYCKSENSPAITIWPLFGSLRRRYNCSFYSIFVMFFLAPISKNLPLNCCGLMTRDERVESSNLIWSLLR